MSSNEILGGFMLFGGIIFITFVLSYIEERLTSSSKENKKLKDNIDKLDDEAQ
tara:strand:+ start:487 stop:645 length:159 start_codon:yes stop_codon:yes gene_type:complete